MFNRAIAKAGSAILFLSVGLAWGQTPSGQPGAYGKGDVITLQEPGKPEQKVKVTAVQRTADGKVSYEVRDVKSGETATITESASNAAAPATPAHKAGLLKSMFSRTPAASSKIEPTPVPVRPVTPRADSKPGTSPSLTPTAATVRPVPQTKSAEPEASVPAEKAPASDWHQSWGKADDHKPAVPAPKPPAPGRLAPMPASAPVPTPAPAPSGPVGMVMPPSVLPVSYPQAGSPYWHVPPSSTAGVASISR
jgi:hypothetical protein